ncbi:hypothetical protein [Acetobacter cerevisiae]|uniref:Glycosyltransferase RgtA/B/C/D-like domain-containing protein n=1 Tax=Acetobacter cerevisiae TaxID=178900 RepID=A0A149QCX8_9PROT|nr:hypothetical protein [Acetobacter cerevisiae]KXU95043.1 hypothetical protein AD928_06270 [Acetobacter cerevisiae]GBQ04817.1 hypothetical protein AA14362_0135 [Acetobacter cerevisiae DSM 14362]
MSYNNTDAVFPNFKNCFGLRNLLILLSGAVVLALVVTGYYLKHEDPAYYWDWGAYFDMYQNFGQTVRHNNRWFARLLVTIRNDDYNLLPISFLAPLSIAFQTSRWAYIAGITIFYLIPAAAVTAICAAFCVTGNKNKNTALPGKAGFAGLFLAALIFHHYWAPTLRGLPDIVGLIPLGLATLLLMRSKFLTQASWRTILCFALLAWLTFALRRWYAFSIVSMMVMASLMAALTLITQQDRKKHFYHLVKAYAATGIVIVILLTILQHTLVHRILVTSYQEAYIAYQAPFMSQLNTVLYSIGPLYTLLFIVGIGLAIINRNQFVLFCASCAILTFVLFSRTQAPGIHHLLPIFFWMVVVSGYTVLMLFAHLSGWTVKIGTAALLVYGALSWGIVFSPALSARLQPFHSTFPMERLFPLHVENMPEYTKLIAQIKAQTKNGEKFAVFSSGGELTTAVLFAFDHSLEPQLAWPSQIDARDHMLLAPLEAPLAIVTDQPITHLAPKDQQVITLPNDCIFNHHDFGTAYQQVAGPFVMSEGHKAYIYRRTRPLSDADIEWIQEQLNHSYPAWKWNHAGMIE